ncbi:putative ribonuclease H-like domain-containing protein [Tanacetum coccineum]
MALNVLDPPTCFPILFDSPYSSVIVPNGYIGHSTSANSSIIGNINEFTLWSEMSREFDKGVVEKMEAPVIIVVSSCRVSRYRARGHLQIQLQSLFSDVTTTIVFSFFSPSVNAITGHACLELVRKLDTTDSQQVPSMVLAIEGKRHTFRFHFNTSSKSGAVDFIMDDVLDEAADNDGTVKLHEDLPGTRTSLEQATLEGAKKWSMVKQEPYLEREFFVLAIGCFSFGAWNRCMQFGPEGMGDDDDVVDHFKYRQYVSHYAIENGNSFKPAAQTTTNVDGNSTTLIPGLITTEEKVQKKNDMKARSMLLMALPNEHLMTFNQYKDAKTLFAAIQTRFGGNEATKKTQKTLLKQMYKNFSAPSTESLDSIFNRLQKIVSQLAILGINDLDTMSFDDLYNNFKIVEQEVKRTASSSLSSSSHNMAFVSSPSSTNEVNTAYGVSTANTQVSPASTQVSTASTQVSTANLSNATVYAFLASQPNGSQLVHKDLEKIREDDLEEMDLKWQYDKSKVECFNCHKMGHFTRECRGPRNQDSRNKNQGGEKNQKGSRRTINVEETSSKAMVAIDGAGFDWSYMVDDEVPRNMDLMAFSESELEKLKQEKERNQLKIEKIDNASKSLDKLIGSQITNKSRKGVGFVSYNAVPPPHTGLFSPPNLDLSYSVIEEFQQSEFERYGPKTSKSVSEDISNEVRESPNAPLVEELVSDDKLEKKTIFPTVAKIEFVRPKQQEKSARKPVKLTVITIKGKGWNMAPRAVLMEIGLRPLNNVRPVNIAHPKTIAHDMEYVISLKLSRNLMEDMLPLGEEPKEGKLLMCDKKNSVLFTDTGCFVPSLDFKLADENQATLDESMLWHRRLGHVNFKTINKLVKENLVRGLPTKYFKNDQTCVACLKGKQHKASCKSKIQNSITQPLFMLHMDLFGPTFVSSLMNKKYCLVVTDDYSRFTWVFFLASKDETSGILKSFITEIENLVDKKVKIIRCDNGTEFKNRVMSEFCEKKGIKKEFSNRVLVVKPHNKTPYELFRGRTPALSFMRPFGCHVTILNTLDYLGKFDGKSDEGFFVGYSMNSKAFRVYNIRTRKVEENLHIRFLEDKPIIAGDGPKWLFDIDVLTKSMNYVPVVAGTNSNDFVDGSLFDSSSKNASNDEPQPPSDAGKKDDEGVCKESGIDDQERPENSTQDVNTAGPSINTEPDMFSLGDNATLEATHADFFGDETEVDMSNITTTYLVPSTPNTRIHKDHSLDHVIGDVQSSVQTRRMTKTTNEQGFISVVYEGKTHKDLHTCLFACFLSQEEPKRIAKSLSDSAWVEAMQEELLQFKLQKGHTQEEGIDYDDVFAPVARIEAIRLFLAYASFMGFMVYQMDVKSAFLYGRIEEEGSYIWEHTYPKLRDALGKRKVSHDDKREKGEEIQYTVTGFVYAFMTILSFYWSRCRTLFVGDKLAPPLETLTPTISESETDWWKASLEYFEDNHVQSEAVSEQLEIEKDGLSEQVQKKKRKRGSSESDQDPTYDQLMTTVYCLEGTGDEREFGVVSDGDIRAYMSPGPVINIIGCRCH